MSRAPSPRPFRLSDALLLIMALAVGLGAIKFVATFNELVRGCGDNAMGLHETPGPTNPSADFVRSLDRPRLIQEADGKTWS